MPVTEHFGLDEKELCDVYGKGEATDRMQFGYSPAVAAEAIAFHRMIAPREWVKQRTMRIKDLLKKRPLSQRQMRSGFEPLAVSSFKLKAHWAAGADRTKLTQESDAVVTEGAEEFLAALEATNTKGDAAEEENRIMVEQRKLKNKAKKDAKKEKKREAAKAGADEPMAAGKKSARGVTHDDSE